MTPEVLGELWDKIRGCFATKSELAATAALKANVSTTLAGYGITDVYTKTEVNGLVDSVTQEQADWNQSDNTAVDYIKNKPSIPVIPSNTAYLSSDSGDGIVPDDGIRAVTVTSAAAMTVNPDVVTVINGAVGTAAITLQVPQDNLAHVWDILMTTDSTVAIAFAMSNSATILAPSGFSVGASKAVEISVIGVGTKYYLRYGEFA